MNTTDLAEKEVFATPFEWIGGEVRLQALVERDQWLACMDQAMGETAVPDELRAQLDKSFFQPADWMVNR
jgi:truncated hemoglobin YjbI